MSQQMISFSCKHCSREFRVQITAAGNRGKCPECQSIIVVPDHSFTELSEPIFGTSATECADPRLQSLFERLALALGSDVRQQILTDEGFLTLVLSTTSSRSQAVLLCAIGLDFGDFLLVTSVVGTVFNYEATYVALKTAGKLPWLKVAIDDTDLLSVSCLLPMDLDVGMLATQVITVAQLADGLEDGIFGWDRY